MAVRSIHLLGSPVLREKSAEVGEVDRETKQFVQDLFDTMRAAQGIGLAANQVGIARRIAVVATADDPPIVLIDPTIVEQEGMERAEEGCLSIPDIFGDVDRPQRVVVETTELDGTRQRVEAHGLTARAVLHEIDHLDGVLFLDHLSPLKRRMLLKKWKKSRKGQTGYIKDISAESATT